MLKNIVKSSVINVYKKKKKNKKDYFYRVNIIDCVTIIDIGVLVN